MQAQQSNVKKFSIEKIGIPVSFILVLVIWSTTPLAIQWSSTGAPMTSALLRMSIGFAFCGSFLILTTGKLPMDKAAIKTYLVGGLSIYGGMSLFYIAAQEIPSGWIAVLFGLSPLTTGLFSAMVEPETKLTPTRIIGLILGFSGIYLVFSAGLNVEDASLYGVSLCLIAVVLTSATSVVSRQLVKDTDISGMQITTGSLMIAIPGFIISAFLLDTNNELVLNQKTVSAILYLGLIGTGAGFTLYYYLLKRVTANRIALVTLVTPISALSLGSWLNSEPLVPEVWVGATFVCIGLLLYEFKPRLGLRKL